MVSRRGTAGDDKDLGSRLRAARQQVQDGRWIPMGMDICLVTRSKTGIRVENRVQRGVQISLRVADRRGGWYTEFEGGGYRKQSSSGTGF